jgi:hypothetical protein
MALRGHFLFYCILFIPFQIDILIGRTSLALRVYHETISAGVEPKVDALSQVLGCMKLPGDTVLRNKLIENLGLGFDVSNGPNVSSLLDGFGEYDPRSFRLLEVSDSNISGCMNVLALIYRVTCLWIKLYLFFMFERLI